MEGSRSVVVPSRISPLCELDQIGHLLNTLILDEWQNKRCVPMNGAEGKGMGGDGYDIFSDSVSDRWSVEDGLSYH